MRMWGPATGAPPLSAVATLYSYVLHATQDQGPASFIFTSSYSRSSVELEGCSELPHGSVPHAVAEGCGRELRALV